VDAEQQALHDSSAASKLYTGRQHFHKLLSNSLLMTVCTPKPFAAVLNNTHRIQKPLLYMTFTILPVCWTPSGKMRARVLQSVSTAD
jgi:hypothetical protein